MLRNNPERSSSQVCVLTGYAVRVLQNGTLNFFLFLLYIASYNLLNIDRVISKVKVREGREAGTIHRWFTGVLLLG